MAGLECTKRLSASIEGENHFPRICVERDHAFSRIRLALPDRKSTFDQVNISPAQLLYLTAAHRGIQCQRRSPSRVLPLRAGSGDLEQMQLLFITQGASDVLANRQRVNVICELVPALCLLEYATDDVQFPIDSCVGNASGFAFADVSQHCGHRNAAHLHVAEMTIDGLRSLPLSLYAARREVREAVFKKLRGGMAERKLGNFVLFGGELANLRR